MSYTFGQIRLRLSKLPHGAGVDPVVLDGLINARYREYLDRCDWSRLVKTATINTVAVYEAGSVEVANGSTDVTGSGTAWTSLMSGRQFRVAGRPESYTFTRTNTTAGTLDRAYEGDDASGVSYKLCQPYYALPADLRVLESVKAPGAARDLDERSREWLDRLDPAREIFGTPELFAPYDDDSTPLPQIELYPIPVAAEGLPIRYQTARARLAATSDVLPDWMSEECLIAGCEADLYRISGDPASAGLMEAKFQQLLKDQVGVEARRLVPEQMAMASRFTRHRRSRALGNDDDDELAILRRS